MGCVNYRVYIKAPQDEVFDLIAKVEGFTNYSRFIKSIEKLGDGIYGWKINILGIPFEWEAKVTEFERPRRFAWESQKGFYNRGSYTLTPVDGKTGVNFEMSYTIRIPYVEKLAAPVVSLVTSGIYKEVLENIKKELEKKTS